MTKLYVFDLDGTLADLTHRLHYVRDGNRYWDKFFEEVDKDVPIQWVINLLDIVRHNGEVLILSGRSSVSESKTREWLKKHSVLYDYLVMRPEGNHKPDFFLKKWMLEDILRDSDFKVQFIVDDRQSVVDMWRKNGYNVLQCNAWKE